MWIAIYSTCCNSIWFHREIADCRLTIFIFAAVIIIISNSSSNSSIVNVMPITPIVRYHRRRQRRRNIESWLPTALPYLLPVPPLSLLQKTTVIIVGFLTNFKVSTVYRVNEKVGRYYDVYVPISVPINNYLWYLFCLLVCT